MTYPTIAAASRIALAIAASFTLIPAATAQQVAAQQTNPSDIQITVHERTVKAPQRKVQQPTTEMRAVHNSNVQRYLIQLQEPSVATYKGGIGDYVATSAKATGQERISMKSAPVRDYASFVGKRQQQVMASIQERVPEVALKGQLNLTLNAVIVEYAGDDLPQRLKDVAGIKSVHADREVYVQTDTSNALIEAPAVWQQLGGQASAGAGVNIAIIDTGIDPEHPMFQDAGHTAPDVGVTDDYCATEPTFCNDKLAVARYFVPAGADLHPDEYVDSPADLDGHGTHVAGTAAGNPLSTTFNGVAVNFSGVAPGANIFAYKALWVNADGTTTGSSISLAQALEAAANDGADVINNSWGSLDNGLAPYEADIVRAIDEMGIVNIAAAGNDGPEESSMGCPACIDEMFAVASTQTGREFATFMEHSDYTDALYVTVGSGNFTISSAISGPFLTAKQEAPTNELACSAFSAGTFTDAIVLVQRGTCTFEQKANNLQAAGAKAMVLYNNEAGFLSMDLAAATLPSVSISQTIGNQLEQGWSAGQQVTINPPEQVINADLRDRLSASSSRGPNRDSTILKPEIAAPGSNILSAYPGQSIALLSGTSMASPHVAGAAALLRALKPSWTHDQIKSALMTSAEINIRQDASDDLATPHQIGAGRVDVAAAADTGITFGRASLNDNACIGACTFERTVTNVSNSSRTWQLSMSFDDANMTADFPSSLTLAANESKVLTVTVNTAFAAEGWQYGRLTLSDSSGTFVDAKLPVAVYTSLSDNTSIISGAVASGEVVTGEAMQLQLRGALGFTDNPTDFSVALPTDAAFAVDYDAIDVTLTRSDQLSYSANPDTGMVLWQGNQNDVPDTVSVTDAPGFAFAGMSLDDVATSKDITISSVCAEGCDDLVAEIELEGDGALWKFDGADRRVFSMWSNGLVEMGPSRALLTANATALPDEAEPNGVIAPLWTDFEFVNGDGEMRYALVTEGADTFLVLEWLRARSWVAPGEVDDGSRYTFNVWFRLNTNEAFFNYVNVSDGGGPVYATAVGLENMRGSVGETYYYSDTATGVYPTNGQALAATFTYGERASVVFDVPATVQDFGALTNVSVTGSTGRATTIDFTEQTEQLGRGFVVLMQVSSIENGVGVEYDAQLPILAAPQGALSGSVVSAPSNGSASFDGLTASYTPNDGWKGTDTFTVQLVDTAGATSATATVTVDVTNAPPEVSVSSPGSVNSGDTVRLDASASSDADGDNLSYQWRVLSGAGVNLSDATAAVATFTAPQVTTNTTVQVEVTVSDGITTSSQTVSVTVTPAPEESSSGALQWFMLVLALPLIGLRRRAFLTNKQ